MQAPQKEIFPVNISSPADCLFCRLLSRYHHCTSQTFLASIFSFLVSFVIFNLSWHMEIVILYVWSWLGFYVYIITLKLY